MALRIDQRVRLRTKEQCQAIIGEAFEVLDSVGAVRELPGDERAVLLAWTLTALGEEHRQLVDDSFAVAGGLLAGRPRH